ncbi:MAG: DUF1326 domain-containing protein [Solirubrobacterales bacterium]
MAANGNTDWRIRGEEVGSCNCDWGCPCQFNANPTHGNCRALIGYQIREGHFGDTNLDGVRWASLVSWPGAIHEGNGTIQVIVDERASEEQRDAILALESGEHGGAYFEIFASVIPNVLDPLTAPIEIETDRERRVASVKVGGIAEARIEPIRNPVDGSEHRVRVNLPDGFEYEIAELGNTVTARSSVEEPLALDLENTYAQLNEFDWAPA